MAISAAAVGAAIADAAASAAAAISAAVAGITVGGVLSAIGGSLLSLGFSYASSALLGSKKPNTDTSAADQSGRTQQVRQSIVARRIVLGRVKVSGVLVYLRSNPDTLESFESAVAGYAAADYKPNQLLWTALVIAGHQVSAVNAITIDDVPAAADKFVGYAHVEYSLGGPDAAANGMLVKETEGEWTPSHRLIGCAALFGAFKFDRAVFTGPPPLAALVSEEEAHV